MKRTTRPAQSTSATALDATPARPAIQFRNLQEQIEAIVAVLPDIVPEALKATIPSAREGAAEAIVADLVPRLRAYGARHSMAARQA
ncbi:hypothetical protein [Streptomyces sp. 900105245]